MPIPLQRCIALPVRALTWLGGQGTRAIAALVFGFFMGVRYQARVESLNEVQTLVQVQ